MAVRIVVVDDEKLVIYGISSLLTETEYEVAASFCSGEEAVKYCIANPPDILLTDIGMPGMSGLELIEKLLPCNFDMKIIVLSCHDEYDMVHRAFMLGADDYILKKDVDKENLCRVLNKVLPKPDCHCGKGAKTEDVPVLPDISRITPGVSGCLAVIGFKSDDSNEDTAFIWQPDIPMLLQLIKNDIAPGGEFYKGLQNELAVFFPDAVQSDKQDIDKLLENARRSISKYINHPVFIARYFITEEDGIIESYRNGLRILDGMFYESKSSILNRPVISAEWKNPLVFSITEPGLEHNWLIQVDSFLHSAKENYVDPRAVKSELVFALKYLLYHIQENSEKPFLSELTGGESFYQRIYQFNDLRRLKEWISMLLKKISDNLVSGREGCGIVFKTKVYVSENLQADLRLTSVADALGVNAAYLSTIFKRENGDSYVDYVNKKRIDHACELLETTDYSAKEIAYRCGYLNSNYFSRIFKKLVNTTISEYRSERDL